MFHISYFQCALHICREEKEDNDEDVEEFKNNYGIEGQSYKCYYNPVKTQEVSKYS